MENLVLYRKYRPQTFSEIVGQEHVVSTLSNAVIAGMVSHGYLFCGPHGCGKTSLARLLAKAVNCQTRKETTAEPCNKCSSCREITEGRAIDLMEIDAASNRGIDEIRDLRESIRFAPTKSKYKIFIVDESHQLTKEAANGLLKTLEEPPSHTIFILATTEVYKMPPTIISRCQRFDFRKLTSAQITERLQTICFWEKVKAQPAALELIALHAAGAVRDAESLLDQSISFSGELRELKAQDIKDLLGLAETASVSRLVGFLSQKQPSQALVFLNDLAGQGLNFQEFTRSLIDYLRQSLLLKISGPDNSSAAGLTEEEFQQLRTQTNSFQEQEIRRILNLLLEAENKMRYSPVPQLSLELAIIESCQQA